MNNKLILIIIGIITICIGVYLKNSGSDMRKRCTSETVGTVVEIIEDKIDNNDPENADKYVFSYTPVLEYNVGDKIVKQKYSSESNKPKYKIGDKIDILYDPNKPEDYLIKEDNDSNTFGIVFIVSGVIIVLFGIIKRDY